MSDTRYVFDNAHGETRERFPALSDLYDDETIRCLQGIGVASGWQCLEVAAGGGSIAQWLAGQVGTSGRVLATDLDARFLESLADPAPISVPPTCAGHRGAAHYRRHSRSVRRQLELQHQAR